MENSICQCGSPKHYRSKHCRDCWRNDKKELSKIGKKVGFSKGYIPWNKNKTGLTKWSDSRREKIMSFLKTGGGMKGKIMSLEARRKISEKLRGEKSPSWKGGIAKINKLQYRRGVEWKIWKDACFRRDNYTCRICLIRGDKLEVHHIKKWSEYPEMRYETENGITLCKKCHKLVFMREKETENFFFKVLKDDKRNWHKELLTILDTRIV